MSLSISLGNVRSVVGAKADYELKVEQLDLMNLNWELREPINIQLTISNKGGNLELSGHVSTVVATRCDLCLEEVIIPVELDVHEELLYSNDLDQFSHFAVGEVEEKYVIYYNDTLDITDIIREGILEALPLKVLCKEGCRGLCLKCGQNLNVKQCNCDNFEVDPRLAILAKLKSAEEV